MLRWMTKGQRGFEVMASFLWTKGKSFAKKNKFCQQNFAFSYAEVLFLACFSWALQPRWCHLWKNTETFPGQDCFVSAAKCKWSFFLYLDPWAYFSLHFPTSPLPILLGRGVSVQVSTWQLITAICHTGITTTVLQREDSEGSLLFWKRKTRTSLRKILWLNLEIHQLQAFLRDICSCGPTAALLGLLVRRPASLFFYVCFLEVWHAAWFTTLF